MNSPRRSILSGTTSVVPLFQCRVCKRPAVRYLGGKRRSFYCDEHGPSKLTDWTRLVPIPVEEYETAGRVVSTAPPLPARVARLIDGLVDGLREVLAQDLPAASVPDAQAVHDLRLRVAELEVELARVQRERDAAEEVAREALDLWPAPLPVVAGPTEVDFPPPDLTPKPRGDEPPSFPDPESPPEPERPRPAKPRRGYTVTPPAPVPPPPAEEHPTPAAPRHPADVGEAALDVFGLDVLMQRIPAGPAAPGLTATRRALKDFRDLPRHLKQAVLDALAILGGEHPEVLREERVPRQHELIGLRATRRLRIICRKEDHTYHIERIVDRSDKQFYLSER